MSEKILNLFKGEIKAVNIGLEIFYLSLRDQGVRVVQVNWQPPPSLEKKLKEKLDKIL
ncbi:MAG: fdrA domain protein [Candidatus Caldarchaeales archaeon]